MFLRGHFILGLQIMMLYMTVSLLFQWRNTLEFYHITCVKGILFHASYHSPAANLISHDPHSVWFLNQNIYRINVHLLATLSSVESVISELHYEFKTLLGNNIKRMRRTLYHCSHESYSANSRAYFHTRMFTRTRYLTITLTLALALG